MKISETATVMSQECLCDGVFSIWIATNIADKAVCGQFVSVYPNSDSKLLPRPISICEIGRGNASGTLRLVYRVAGEGTRGFSQLKAGDTVRVLGPNGNGFFAALSEEIKPETKALLVGGGIGIPPMLELAKELSCDVTIVAGYRNADGMFLKRELSEAGRLVVSTDDGSSGTKGTVVDAIKQNRISCDIIFACGPAPMLRGIKSYSQEAGVSAYVSMEERMACGIGACLGCVCGSTDTDDHSKVRNKRVCADGPVFNAAEVEI